MPETIVRSGVEFVIDNENGGAWLRVIDYHAREIPLDVELAEKLLAAARKAPASAPARPEVPEEEEEMFEVSRPPQPVAPSAATAPEEAALFEADLPPARDASPQEPAQGPTAADNEPDVFDVKAPPEPARGPAAGNGEPEVFEVRRI